MSATMSAIDQRIDLFRELHKNIWFQVMNWVLDQLRLPKERRRESMISHCFFFNYKEIKRPVYKYWHL